MNTTSNFEKNIAVVTPINKDPASRSNEDYMEQQGRQSMMWDDSRGNPTKTAGGAFGFVHNGNRVEIHLITGIANPVDRMPSWSKNVGQTDRNVLMLTPKLCEISWDDWLDLGGAQKIQGTTRVVGGHRGLCDYLDRVLGDVTFCPETTETICKG